ncbi:ECF-type sigma factor [Aeoliella sp. ICT_H6.2]|uniref:ECF-type sigma factor n=1 Tax=Aeoliella straminimaris TaxID=2954799 RepID=A0A9X2F817_9BACT|nr:ECF-type sigma factor [Aeoliella straminimaris]MCO6044060.1 ECF-type sigma factor [Aeoliella straminimaris]
MADVTQILSQIEQGDPSAAEQLLPLVYDELRMLAAARLTHEKPGQTLQATALVHEAYLRLLGPDADHRQDWNGRGHFFAAAAQAMRRILINQARDRARFKRGGGLKKLDLDSVQFAMETPSDELLTIDEAIEQLELHNPACAKVVNLRFFAGLSTNETAAAMEISASTVKRHWAYARAWLYDALSQDEDSGSA